MHPTYEATDQSHRWQGGPLRRLFELLDKAAKDSQGKTQWRCLPNGAIVALRYTDDLRRELKIVRKEAPKTARGPELFQVEAATFIREFAIAHYLQQPHPEKEGVGIGIVLVEPVVRSGHYVLCTRCKTELVLRDDCFTSDGQQCTGCAFESGREFTAEIHRRAGSANGQG